MDDAAVTAGGAAGRPGPARRPGRPARAPPGSPRPSSRAASSTWPCWTARTGRRSCRRPRFSFPTSRRTSHASSATPPSGIRTPSSTATRSASFPTAAADGPLLAELARLALACWDLFGLRGWARVDFRVDETGQPLHPRGQRQPLPVAGRGLRRGPGPGRHPLRRGRRPHPGRGRLNRPARLGRPHVPHPPHPRRHPAGQPRGHPAGASRSSGSSSPTPPKRDIDGLTEKLRDPFPQRFRAILHVAERRDGQVQGFALVLHEPELRMCYPGLHRLQRPPDQPRHRRRPVPAGARGGRRGSACGPSSSSACPTSRTTAATAASWRPTGPGCASTRTSAPGRWSTTTTTRRWTRATTSACRTWCSTTWRPGEPLRRRFVRDAVRAILERKYAHLCPPEYVEQVVASFKDDPVSLRAPRYVRSREGCRRSPPSAARPDRTHRPVRQRQARHPPRARPRLRRGAGAGDADPGRAGQDHPVRAAAGPHALPGIRTPGARSRPWSPTCARSASDLPAGESVYPYVFPIRNASRPPTDLAMRAGYYCIDTFTPLNRNAFLAARGAVDCALAGAEAIAKGRRLAYALVRPPGHHAERRVFGGFCYFNNTADRRPRAGRAWARWRSSTWTTTTATGSRTSSTPATTC